MRSSLVATEHVILECHPPVTVPVQNKPPSSSRNSKYLFQYYAKRNDSPGSETVKLFASLYYMGDASLPEY